jgi:hypothetical protein
MKSKLATHGGEGSGIKGHYTQRCKECGHTDDREKFLAGQMHKPKCPKCGSFRTGIVSDKVAEHGGEGSGIKGHLPLTGPGKDNPEAGKDAYCNSCGYTGRAANFLLGPEQKYENWKCPSCGAGGQKIQLKPHYDPDSCPGCRADDKAGRHSRIALHFIRKERTGGWSVRSHKGKSLGKYRSKKKAVKRLRQVEYFKHHPEASGKRSKQFAGGPDGGIVTSPPEEIARISQHNKTQLHIVRARIAKMASGVDLSDGVDLQPEIELGPPIDLREAFMTAEAMFAADRAGDNDDPEEENSFLQVARDHIEKAFAMASANKEKPIQAIAKALSEVKAALDDDDDLDAAQEALWRATDLAMSLKHPNNTIVTDGLAEHLISARRGIDQMRQLRQLHKAVGQED